MMHTSVTASLHIGSDTMTLAPTLTTLDALKAGQSATVITLAPGSLADASGADVSRRLMELGFVPVNASAC